jgi:hypothetical protein
MKCHGKTKNGSACKMPPLKGTRYCFTHNPETRTAQAQARKLGGYNTHTPHAGNAESIPSDIQTIAQARGIITYTLAELLVMDNSIPRARALLSAFDSFVKAFEIGELEARIAALEAGRK